MVNLMNPYISIIIGALLGSTAGIFIKKLGLSVTSIAFFRFLVPIIIVLVFLLYKKVRLFTGNYKTMLLASTFNAIRLSFYFIAYMYTTLTNAILILFTWPIFAAIFGIFILKEKVTKKQFLLFALAFSGIVVMNLGNKISFSNKDFIGMGAMLISAIVLALANVSYKKAIDGYSNFETIFYQNFVGAIIFLPFIFINPTPSLSQVSWGVVYGALIGVGAFYFFFYAMRRLKMANYSLFKYTEIIFNVMFGVLVFSDQITLKIFLGGGMIILAGLLLRKNR